tara:strand:+ start:802 stop:2799 length:1998 start_codon:yes stop_codon:yes gene_type:complete
MLAIFSFLFSDSILYKDNFLFQYYNENDFTGINNYNIELQNKGVLKRHHSYNVKKFIDPITRNTHFIHSQLHKGIIVFGRSARLHLNKFNQISTFSNNFHNGEFDTSEPTITKQQLYVILDNDFLVTNKKITNENIIYFVKDNYAFLAYDVNAVTYDEGYRYIINAHTGDIIKKWSLVYHDGPTIGEGENLLGELVDELHIYEGGAFSLTGDLITPYFLCEAYCFDYGDCGGSNNSGCIINPQQGTCPENYLEDCNGDCFHEWYLQFPGVGNGFCNDPWINVDDESIQFGSFNMVDESNLNLGAIFTINSYGGFYENLSYVNSVNNTFYSSTSSESHASGVSAHDYQRKTLDYFWDYHNYAGIDGQGKRTISIVNYGTGGGISQNNAFFNAGLDVLSYGIAGGNYRPFCAAQDIVAHEFTHGFTAHTSGLIYENQPGALNESLSDAFGYFVEAEFQNGGDWTEGEDIRINGGASRSFENPPLYGDPDSINHPYYMPPVDNPNMFTNDFGGVHSNSGIPNKVLYLVIKGDEHYGINVEPFDDNIDQSRYIASDIWYAWNRYYLDAEDNFEIAREKMLQVSYDLFPNDLSNYKTISNAWASVGVGNQLISGDINNDTIINIQDIIILIGAILGSNEFNQHETVAADMNFDGIINILDVVSIIDIIMS